MEVVRSKVRSKIYFCGVRKKTEKRCVRDMPSDRIIVQWRPGVPPRHLSNRHRSSQQSTRQNENAVHGRQWTVWSSSIPGGMMRTKWSKNHMKWETGQLILIKIWNGNDCTDAANVPLSRLPYSHAWWKKRARITHATKQSLLRDKIMWIRNYHFLSCFP